MIRSLSSALARIVAKFKRPAHIQVAALCTRQNGEKREVLVITTRGSGRWILPKGWAMEGRALAEAALVEAWEEAGVRGTVADPEPVGHYKGHKIVAGGLNLATHVHVFEIAVRSISDDFPEAGTREKRWVSMKRAAKMVEETGLKRLLKELRRTG